MKNLKYILLSILLAIIIAFCSVQYTESINREYSVIQHIIVFIIGALSVWGIGIWKAGFNIYSVLYMIPFGFMYWIFFDFTTGYLLTKSIWHIGTTGTDIFFKNVFQSGKGLFIFKLFWFFLSLSIVNRLFHYKN
jgi:hypothetical protein